MKKTFVVLFVLVCVLSFSGAALAAQANPFANVPSNHWSYSAAAQLVKAGLVDGYGDDFFRSDKKITRYEMAQVTAKAMANSDKANAETKANIEKLAIEFAPELNNLGVPGTKVEHQNASPIKFSGDARLRWINIDKGATNPAFTERFRLGGTIRINDNTSFYFREAIENYNTLGTYTVNKSNVVADANASFKNLLPNFDLKAGRYSLILGQTNYLACGTGRFDGVEAIWTEGNNKLKFGYADSNPINDPSCGTPSTFKNAGNIYYSEFRHTFDDQLNANLLYIKNQNPGHNAGQDIIDIFGGGMNWKIGNDWAVIGDYWRNSAKDAKIKGSTPEAMVLRLQYKTINPTQPGSSMFFIEYLKADPYTMDTNWSIAYVNGVNAYNALYGIKAYDVQYSQVLSKNVVIDAIYQWNIKGTTGVGAGAGALGNHGENYTRIQLNFYF
jgi:hypothetical protein